MPSPQREKGPQDALRTRPLPQGLVRHARPQQGQRLVREDPELRPQERRKGRQGHHRRRRPKEARRDHQAGQDGVRRSGKGPQEVLRRRVLSRLLYPPPPAHNTHARTHFTIPAPGLHASSIHVCTYCAVGRIEPAQRGGASSPGGTTPFRYSRPARVPTLYQPNR